MAFVATMHAGQTGSSAAYVSRYLPEGQIPPSISLNLIAKVAGRIEENRAQETGSPTSVIIMRSPASSSLRIRGTGDSGGR